MSYVIQQNTRANEAPPEPPVNEQGLLYPFMMHFDGLQSIAYSDSPRDLLGVLIDGYSELTDEEDLVRARIRFALSVQQITQAMINAQVDESEWNAMSEKEREVLTAPRFQQPHGWADENSSMGDVWSSEIPLVLVDTGYEPYTDINQPISIHGQYEQVPNMYWIRPADEWEFLKSLAEVSYISLHVANDVL